eukprot:SM000028S10195  [mRNA]  locus=s28:948191:948671:+ [translate_table: standard]
MTDFWVSLPILVLLAPFLAILGGCFTLAQFSYAFSALARQASRPASNSIAKLLRPFLKSWVRHLTAMLGDADKFLTKVGLTHVILCAILLVLIVSLERLHGQLARPPGPGGRR